MTIHIEDETGEALPFSLQETADLLIQAVMEELESPFDAEADLLLTNDEEIHQINLENRGIDAATDVLSFPTAEFLNPGDLSELEDEVDLFDPETGFFFMGDIVISLDHAKAQAEEYGHSLKREIAFLITHSLLHLCGFDHMEDDMRLEMEDLQRKILDNVGISR